MVETIESPRMNIWQFLFIIIGVIVVLLFPWDYEYDPMPPSRWQWRGHGLLLDVTFDYWEDRGVDLYFALPDEHCYGSLGGNTGHLFLARYANGILDVRLYGGDWWGQSSDFHWGNSSARLSNWCAGAVWYSSWSPCDIFPTMMTCGAKQE